MEHFRADMARPVFHCSVEGTVCSRYIVIVVRVALSTLPTLPMMGGGYDSGTVRFATPSFPKSATT